MKTSHCAVYVLGILKLLAWVFCFWERLKLEKTHSNILFRTDIQVKVDFVDRRGKPEFFYIIFIDVDLHFGLVSFRFRFRFALHFPVLSARYAKLKPEQNKLVVIFSVSQWSSPLVCWLLPVCLVSSRPRSQATPTSMTASMLTVFCQTNVSWTTTSSAWWIKELAHQKAVNWKVSDTCRDWFLFWNRCYFFRNFARRFV